VRQPWGGDGKKTSPSPKEGVDGRKRRTNKITFRPLDEYPAVIRAFVHVKKRSEKETCQGEGKLAFSEPAGEPRDLCGDFLRLGEGETRNLTGKKDPFWPGKERHPLLKRGVFFKGQCRDHPPGGNKTHAGADVKKVREGDLRNMRKKGRNALVRGG